MIGAF
jgi:hypothetical protein